MVKSMTNLEKAKQLLDEGGFTLVLVSDNDIQTDVARGVHPLLNRYGKDLSSYSAADKVIGRGAALLYVGLKIKEIYCRTISESALEVLNKYEIPVTYDNLVKNIINHFKTGFCPIEEATKNASTPEEALPLIIAKLKELGEK